VGAEEQRGSSLLAALDRPDDVVALVAAMRANGVTQFALGDATFTISPLVQPRSEAEPDPDEKRRDLLGSVL
jgi:hypothetical protein